MLKRRIGMSVIGVTVCAVSVGIFKIAALGVDPFQSLMSGLNQFIPISFGTLYVIVNALLLIFSIFADRTNIGIATFVNLFLLGYITEFSYAFLQKVIVNPNMLIRLICLALGIVIMCIGSAFYMTAKLGVSTYDAIAIVLSEKWKLGKFKYIRIMTDLTCIVLGIVFFLLGKGKIGAIPTIVGIGTVVTAFFMGPLIQYFNEKLAIPFLNR
jgi:uncharacterized membrane protein YczE